jgi:hypothetical protein
MRKVILKNWDELGRIFNNDRQSFSFYMDVINKHRIDAHAKDIDEEAIGILLGAFRWLHLRVNEFLE